MEESSGMLNLADTAVGSKQLTFTLKKVRRVLTMSDFPGAVITVYFTVITVYNIYFIKHLLNCYFIYYRNSVSNILVILRSHK